MKNAYACINKDESLRRDESSGGVFSLLARYTLRCGGIVFAAVYDENLNVVHRGLKAEKELSAAYGAKYAASKFVDCFQEIKISLEEKKKVLFVGTPCQCAALRHSVGEHDYLICVDFVCHGVPDSKYWQMYLRSLQEANGLLIKSVNMRDKTSGWTKYRYCWKFEDKNGRLLYQKQRDNLYMKGFVENYYLQQACYSCQFKGNNRFSEITLGDFWGVWETKPEFDDDKGTSLVIIRSEKGRRLFNAIRSDLLYTELDESDYIGYNPSLIKTATKPDGYDCFQARLKNGEDIQKLIAEYTGSEYKKGVILEGRNYFRLKLLGSNIKRYLKESR